MVVWDPHLKMPGAAALQRGLCIHGMFKLSQSSLTMTNFADLWWNCPCVHQTEASHGSEARRKFKDLAETKRNKSYQGLNWLVISLLPCPKKTIPHPKCLRGVVPSRKQGHHCLEGGYMTEHLTQWKWESLSFSRYNRKPKFKFLHQYCGKERNGIFGIFCMDGGRV